VSGPARTGIAHHAWPGGLAVVFEGAGADTAAVFGPGGWEHGPRRLIFSQGPPAGAASSFLVLPQTLVDQLAVQPFSGGALHTDFVFLDRLVRRFTPGTDDVVLLVLGRSPGALLCSGGRVTVIEPAAADEPLHMLLPSLSGWIVVISGKVSFTPPAPPPGPHAATSAAAHAAASAPAPAAAQAATPPPAQPRVHEPPRPVRGPEPAAPPPAAEGARPSGNFGRFAPESLFMLASGAAGQLPSDVTDRIAVIAGEAWTGLVALLDGAHTLQQIATSTGVAAHQVAEVVDLLVSSKLAFKYVSRTRPQAGAPASPGRHV